MNLHVIGSLEMDFLHDQEYIYTHTYVLRWSDDTL